ncbi:MAG: sialidase family protein [Caldilineaceae bacterium]
MATSEDGGRTWRYLSTVAGHEAMPTTEPRGHGPGEPSLVQLRTGELMCVMRMGGGEAFHLRRSYSRMAGAWSTGCAAGLQRRTQPETFNERRAGPVHGSAWHFSLAGPMTNAGQVWQAD